MPHVREQERGNVGVGRRGEPAALHKAKVFLQPGQATFRLFPVRRFEGSVEFLAANAKDNAKPI
jgi:hypothetical protein